MDAFRSPAVFSQVSQGATSTSSAAERQHFGANSSAVGFAAHLFGDSAASYSSDIASIPGHVGRPARGLTAAAAAAAHVGASWSLVRTRVPPPIVVEALLDAYFDRLHWFINLFHEPALRQTAQEVLSKSRWHRSELGAVLAALMVLAMGLQCVVSDASWTGHALLSDAGLEASSLREALIQEVRLHLMDLLDDCCIETVQVCSLLGTYYMFHASPTLAWSILGMSVRTAYALALHCDNSSDGHDDGSQNDSELDPVLAQVRRRNWNHITVSDTFAAMIYGRPASLDAAFSHVQPLQDLDDTKLGPGLSSHPLLASSSPSSSCTSTGPPPPATKLTFHVLKFRLYGIIRQALNRFRLLRLQNPISPDELASLVQAVQHARAQLDAWRADLPPLFDIDASAGATAASSASSTASAASTTALFSEEAVPVELAELAKIPGLPSDEQAHRRHLSLQVLTLHVTYDSAVIFVHRPLLEYRVPADARHAVPQPALDVVAQSLDMSVQAALRMSQVPVALLERQFVISFVLMNLFTAGVILCIPPTTWPLSAIAHKAKAGTMRIIRASRALKHVSHIAMHTEKLLTRLLKLSLQQEIETGFQEESSGEEEAGRSSQERNQQRRRHQQHQQHRRHLRDLGRTSLAKEAGSPSSYGVHHNNLPELVRTYPQQQQQQQEEEETALQVSPGQTAPPAPRSVSTAVEHPPATIAIPAPFSLGHDSDADTGGGHSGHHIDLIPSTTGAMYSDGQLTTSADFRRPAMGYYYAEQRQQVDSQLDEAFGTFGQSKSSI